MPHWMHTQVSIAGQHEVTEKGPAAALRVLPVCHDALQPNEHDWYIIAAFTQQSQTRPSCCTVTMQTQHAHLPATARALVQLPPNYKAGGLEPQVVCEAQLHSSRALPLGATGASSRYTTLTETGSTVDIGCTVQVTT
jgi:hypothetical protein